MELNIDKCYLSVEADDSFIDPISKNIIPKKDKVKYYFLEKVKVKCTFYAFPRNRDALRKKRFCPLML